MRCLWIVAIGLVSLAVGCGGSDGPSIEDLNGDGEIVVIAFGDSNTRGFGDGDSPRVAPPIPVAGYPARLATVIPARVINAGVGGEETQEGKARLPELLAANPADYVVIVEGVNNILRGRASRVIGDLQEMIDIVIASGAVPVLGTLTPLCCGRPQAVGGVNPKIIELAMMNAIQLADFAHDFAPTGPYDPESNLIHQDDGLHPTPAGYDVMANTAANVFGFAFAPPQPEEPDPTPEV